MTLNELEESVYREVDIWKVDLGNIYSYQGFPVNQFNPFKKDSTSNVTKPNEKRKFYEFYEKSFLSLIDSKGLNTHNRIKLLIKINSIAEFVLLNVDAESDNNRIRKRYLEEDNKAHRPIDFTIEELNFWREVQKLHGDFRNIFDKISIKAKSNLKQILDIHLIEPEDIVSANFYSPSISIYRKHAAFVDLIRYKFIDSNTKYEEFNTLFRKPKYVTKINWVSKYGSELKYLIYYINKDNEDLLCKFSSEALAESCFLFNGVDITKKEYRGWNLIKSNPKRKKTTYSRLDTIISHLNSCHV